ncbi:MAG: adenosine deaminase family protein [Candidatus Acidiferrales bacterium]
MSPFQANYRRILRFVPIAILLLATFALAQSPPAPTSPRPIAKTPAIAEQRAARALESVRQNPLELHDFLVRMPKGADLHSHLTGAVYAESWIRDGAEDALCVDLVSLSFFKTADQTKETTRSIPPQPVCGEGRVAASHAFSDQNLYDSLIDSFSMRSFVPSAGVSGHDHFFATFSKFGGVNKDHHGEWLDEVSARAAAQNEQYLELMDTPPFAHTIRIANEIGWQEDLAKFRQQLLDRGLRDDVAVARAHWDQSEALRNERQHCGKPDAAPGCAVRIRFLYQVLRGFPKQQVFAQALLGFEVASADPRVPGINFVMPEDGYTSMTDYALHMRMVGYLHSVYPSVRITLHAGELAPGLVTREGLCCHVRLAVEEAHAERIGHGVDLMYEDRPYDLLKEMAAKHVMVEINLTSNDVILGITGNSHPFPLYRKFGVPVALSTDDEGVSRIDLTHEYVRAVQTYNLRYADLKKLVRTGLEHSFLTGESLWEKQDDYSQANAACGKEILGAEKPSDACAKFLQSSERAQQQWDLEHRFRAFEQSF